MDIDEPTQPNPTTGLDLASQIDWQEISSGGGGEGRAFSHYQKKKVKGKEAKKLGSHKNFESEAVTGVKKEKKCIIPVIGEGGEGTKHEVVHYSGLKPLLIRVR